MFTAVTTKNSKNNKQRKREWERFLRDTSHPELGEDTSNPELNKETLQKSSRKNTSYQLVDQVHISDCESKESVQVIQQCKKPSSKEQTSMADNQLGVKTRAMTEKEGTNPTSPEHQHTPMSPDNQQHPQPQPQEHNTDIQDAMQTQE